MESGGSGLAPSPQTLVRTKWAIPQLLVVQSVYMERGGPAGNILCIRTGALNFPRNGQTWGWIDGHAFAKSHEFNVLCFAFPCVPVLFIHNLLISAIKVPLTLSQRPLDRQSP